MVAGYLPEPDPLNFFLPDLAGTGTGSGAGSMLKSTVQLQNY